MFTNNKVTKIFNLRGDNPDKNEITEAAEILKSGGLLAFPTETVYGLGADATNPRAAEAIYKAKGRPSDNPLIVHIADICDLDKVAVGNLNRAKELAKVFWPGPLTLVLKKSSVIPKETTGGLDTVAVRMPDRKAALEVIRQSRLFVAAPSANISGKPSPTCAEHVIDDFDGKIDGIIDDGPSSIGLESTVLDLTSVTPVILRLGYIEKEDIEQVLGESVVLYSGAKENVPRSPGMKYKHYSPTGDLYIVKGQNKFKTISAFAKYATNDHMKVAVITCEENKDNYRDFKIYSVGERNNSDTILKNLYRVLRQLDKDEVQIAFCESFYKIKHGNTVMERLEKASGGKVINANKELGIAEWESIRKSFL